MAKQSGLGDGLLVGGYDISGDIQALDQVQGGPALLDVTDITQSAHSRIGALRSGAIAATTFFDASNAHPVLDALPTADVDGMYLRGTSLGDPAACIVARQVGYDPTRGTDGSLTLKTQLTSDGYGLEWGEQVTPGVRTDTTATDGSTQDDGAGFTAPSVPSSGTAATNTTSIPASVVVTGGTVSQVDVNGVSKGTGDGTYIVPPGGTITLTYTSAPTWTWTLESADGAQLYLQVTAITGTSVTVTIQHSADNSTWSTLGTAFTAVTAAPGTQRLTATGTVDRYLRANSTGTFTKASFAAVVVRNLTTVAF